MREVGNATLGGARVNIVKAKAVDAANGFEREDLKFGLGAVADDRRSVRLGWRQRAGGERRGARSTQRGEQGHLREQLRITSGYRGDDAEGGNSLQTALGVGGVAR